MTTTEFDFKKHLAIEEDAPNQPVPDNELCHLVPDEAMSTDLPETMLCGATEWHSWIPMPSEQALHAETGPDGECTCGFNRCPKCSFEWERIKGGL